jgi:osmoprotectant transport system substrate-binding protein
MGKKVITIAEVFLALIMIVMAAGCTCTPSRPDVKEVIIGNKNFTEQHIIGELMKQLLEDRGFKVQLVSGLSSVALREQMKDGNIDICADYTGTAWMVYLGRDYEPGTDNNELYHHVKQEDFYNGLVWFTPIWNNNTYALASWTSFAVQHNITTLSDLASLYREQDGNIGTSVGLEFSTRIDGLPGLEKHYNFKVAEASLIIKATAGASLQDLKERECDVAMVFGTDAMIAEHSWHVYVDDRCFFPPYDLAPYGRKEIIDEYSEIPRILNELVETFPGGGKPSTPEIIIKCRRVWQELNARVDIDKMEAYRVAHEYLVKHGLVKE